MRLPTGTPKSTYGIMRFDEGIVDCHDLHIAVLDTMDMDISSA